MWYATCGWMNKKHAKTLPIYDRDRYLNIKRKFLRDEIEHDVPVTHRDDYKPCEIPCDR